jgi:hypothetical protein
MTDNTFFRPLKRSLAAMHAFLDELAALPETVQCIVA